MNEGDAQMLRDISYFTKKLLDHAELLPPELEAMLREYESELGKYSPGRWDGIADRVQYDDLAQNIGQSIADGEWSVGMLLDCSLDKWYCRGRTRKDVEGALQLLAVRGELDLKDGMYHVRSRDESS